MGHPDPEIARETSPNSLRAIYGKSLEENGVAGPPDNKTAEAQILALFASSPPFPPLDSKTNSIRSIASSILLELQQAGEEAEDSYAAVAAALQEGPISEAGSPSVASTAIKSERAVRPASASAPRKSSFKARPLPSSTIKPTIQPRMSRAAALRIGLPDPTIRRTVSDEERNKTFENVPGHKRSETIKVASTATPAIVPRLTKAAALRMGIKGVSKGVNKPVRPRVARPSTAGGMIGGTFEGVPGHKRRETISVASTNVPNILPRINRSALLRQKKDVAPPTSHMCKCSEFCIVQNSAKKLILNIVRAPTSGTSKTQKVSTEPVVRPVSVIPAIRRDTIVVASTRPPSVPPRGNRSSMLRAKDGHGPSSFRREHDFFFILYFGFVVDTSS
jgi:hypothetical protein